MPEALASREFSVSQVERMITEIGEILGVLQSKGVLDYRSSHAANLLHRGESDLQFERTELLEVKRFTSLFKSSAAALTYLVRNPRSETLQISSVRTDRIMGAVSPSGTIQNLRKGLNGIACVELVRNPNTPANRLLCSTLIATAIFCKGYITRKGRLFSDTDKCLDSPTLLELLQIQQITSQLLNTKFVRDTLETVELTTSQMESDLRYLRYALLEERITRPYASLLQFFQRWRDWVWVTSTEDVIQHGLRYHFFSLGDHDKLYESWVCFKVLRAVVDSYDVVLAERNSRTGILFRSNSGIGVRYQRRFATGWEFAGEEKEAVPDVIVEISGEVKLVIDAKNTDWERLLPDIYRRQVGEYLHVTHCKRGVLLHSSGPHGAWEMMTKKETQEEINWAPLIPGSDKENTETLTKVIDMIR